MGKCNGDRTTDGVCTGVGGGDGCYTTTEERIELLGCSDWRRLQILDKCEERRHLFGNTEQLNKGNNMSTWILIITIISYGYSGHSSTGIESIQFNSRESCIAASEFYADNVKNTGYHKYSAVCVQK